MPDDKMPLINIYQPADDIYTVIVEHADRDQFPHARVEVDISPVPTWKTVVEVNDGIAEAVRRVLDLAWESATGEPVTR